MVMVEILKINPIRHQVAIAGRVAIGYRLTGETEWTLLPQRLAQVQVEIIDAPPIFQKQSELKALGTTTFRKYSTYAQTTEDGSFYFLDLPEGEYTLKATWSHGYKASRSVEGKTTITAADTPAWLNLIFPTTGIVGQVTQLTTQPVDDDLTANYQPLPVAQAHIQIKGSNHQTWSDRNGEFEFLYLESLSPGTDDESLSITLEITADGYQAQTLDAQTIQRGIVHRQEIQLAKVATPPSTNQNINLSEESTS
jgi:hypothetical protein